MRTFAIWTFVLALATCAAARDESVEELKSRLPNAPAADRAAIAVRIAELQLRNADKSYADGNIDKAHAAVDDIVTYSEKARDAALETKKHLKTTEISIRKIADKLKDIKRTLAFEDQPQVEHAIQRLEEVRTILLKEMFKKEKK